VVISTRNNIQITKGKLMLENPLRYKDNTTVFHKVHGWGKTFNPRVGSYYVEVEFGDNPIITVHEDYLSWPITYEDKCVVFGLKLAKNGGLTWFYSANEKLDGRCPRDAVDAGELELVEKIFDETFS